MPERIIRTTQQQLQPGEVALLKNKVNRLILLYLPGYLLLAGAAIYILLDPPGSYTTVVNRAGNLDDDETARMWKLAPYFSAFVLLLATIFFGRLFYSSVLPLLKDVRQKTKTLIYFKPAKSAMGFFNRYYLSTPLYQNQQIEVSHDDFDSIDNDDELHIEVGSHSMLVLRLCHREREIKFY